MITSKSWAVFLIAIAAAGVASEARQKPEATSLAGKPLVRIALPDQQKLEANLVQAEKELAAKPTDADAIIWVGRRLGYLWRYQDAIAMFSKGVALHPEQPEALPPPRPSLHHGPGVRSRCR